MQPIAIGCWPWNKYRKNISKMWRDMKSIKKSLETRDVSSCFIAIIWLVQFNWGLDPNYTKYLGLDALAKLQYGFGLWPYCTLTLLYFDLTVLWPHCNTTPRYHLHLHVLLTSKETNDLSQCVSVRGEVPLYYTARSWSKYLSLSSLSSGLLGFQRERCKRETTSRSAAFSSRNKVSGRLCMLCMISMP